MLDPISESMGTATGMAPLERPEFKDVTGNDIATARKNLVELIDQAMKEVPTMLYQCASSQDSKMYSAAAQFISTIGELNHKLSKINAPLKPGAASGKTQTEDPKPEVHVTHQPVFVGSTEELIKMMKKQRDADASILEHS